MNELRETIMKHRIFNGMEPAHLTVLSEGARPAKFNTGEVLFREGEPADRFFLIQKGKVVLEAHEPANGTVAVQEVGAGDVLGWSWLFPPFVWHFQARAIEPTEVIVLNATHVLVAAERDHDLGFEVMKRVAQVVIHRLQATRRQLLEREIESALQA